MFKTYFHVILLLFLFLFIFLSCAVDKEEIEVSNSNPQSIDNKSTSKIDNENQSENSKEISQSKENLIIGDADLGKKWFEDQGCSTCHSTNEDTLIGPGLSNVFLRAKEHIAHNHHETDLHTPEEYIETSIRNPGEFVVDGFENLMPENWDDVDQKEIEDVIAYLKMLE